MGFYRDAAGLLLTLTAGTLIGFATSVLLARFLTPEDRGVYALAISFADPVEYDFRLSSNAVSDQGGQLLHQLRLRDQCPLHWPWC